jgi:hypothetical protein
VSMTLASTLKSIELLNMPMTMVEGDSAQLQVKVLDIDDAQIFLPNGALSWSLVFGGGFISVDDEGNVIANAAGSARVRVSEIGAGLYSDGDITVEVPEALRARAESTSHR